MKDIYIIGSGGFAKEVLFLIEDVNKSIENVSEKYIFKGFIDLKEGECKIGSKSHKIFLEEQVLLIKDNINIAIGTGDPVLNNKIIAKFKENNNFIFPNLIHPNFSGMKETIRLVEGNIITSGCIFTVDVTLNSFNIINLNTTVGHDTIIGSFNVFNPGVNISGGVKIGNSNLFGTNATVLQYLNVENNSILGSGAVLTKDLESNKVAIGIPAKTIN